MTQINQIPRLLRGATRIRIRGEVFDYIRRGDQLAVVHWPSRLSFALRAPDAPDPLKLGEKSLKRALDRYREGLERAIWERYRANKEKTA